jgi:hypothetical protein
MSSHLINPFLLQMPLLACNFARFAKRAQRSSATLPRVLLTGLVSAQNRHFRYEKD